MGPAGICTALYPPRPSRGPGVRFPVVIALHHIGIYIYIFTVTHYYFAAINIMFALVVIWIVSFLWILYFGMVHRYGLQYL
jgi:hypothetical protein